MYYFKCFHKGLINSYNIPFEVGVLYHTDGVIRYGTSGNGFHVALNLEDTLRFFTIRKDNELIMNEDIDIAMVKCYGAYDEIKDSMESRYSGDRDMYAFEYMIIERILSREEIIAYALNLHNERAKKFLMYYKLTEEEKQLFRNKFKNNDDVLSYIAYYQDNDKEVFNRKFKTKEKRLI